MTSNGPSSYTSGAITAPAHAGMIRSAVLMLRIHPGRGRRVGRRSTLHSYSQSSLLQAKTCMVSTHPASRYRPDPFAFAYFPVPRTFFDVPVAAPAGFS
jgi:hypothetical protein